MTGWIVLGVYLAGVLLTTRLLLLRISYVDKRLTKGDKTSSLIVGLLWPVLLPIAVAAGAFWLLWKAATVGIRR